MSTSQRAIWNDKPERLSGSWTLTKAGKIAECSTWSHQFGWELRLEVAGSMVRTQVARTAPEMLKAFDEWKQAMLGAGWTEPA